MSKPKITPSVKKFVLAFDIHAGFEKRYVGKDSRTFPTHSPASIAACLEFIKDFKPDHITLGGDQLNFAPISHWNTTNFWANEGGRIRKELDVLDELVLDPLEKLIPLATTTWHLGNHEAWLQQFINRNPALEGLIEPENHLDLSKWKIIEQGGMSHLGKLGIIHGDTLGRTGNPARRASSMYNCNIRFGHFHTYDAHTQYNPVNARDVKTSVCVPALAAIGQSYGKGAPSWALNGFNFGYVWPDGRYSDYTVVMADGRFIGPGGKVYDGKELMRKNKY